MSRIPPACARARWVSLCILVVSLLWLAAPALAESPKGSAPASSKGWSDYLIPLPMPSAEEVSAQARALQGLLSPAHEALSRRQALPIMAGLEQLESQRQVRVARVRPDLHAVHVRAADAGALASLPGGAGAIAASPADAPPSVAARARALDAMVSALVSDARLAGENGMPYCPGDGNPSVCVYYAMSGEYGYVHGQTDPMVQVQLQVHRQNRLVTQATTTSKADGSYAFHPSWIQCPREGWDWLLRPGDTIQVGSGGTTVDHTVAPLSGWVDTTTRQIVGTTLPNHEVEIRGALPDHPGSCATHTFTDTLKTPGSGEIGAPLVSPGPVGLTEVQVYAKDLFGNASHTTFRPFSIRSRFDAPSIYGYVKPDMPFQATLSRGGNPISTKSGTSDAAANYAATFDELIQPGDLIQVTGDGLSISYEATHLDATVDAVTDTIWGSTGPGRGVMSSWGRRSDPALLTDCATDAPYCVARLADGQGDFSMTTIDILRGDPVDLWVVDSQGFYQAEYSLAAPAIVANLSDNAIQGYWSTPRQGEIAYQLTDSGGSTKASGNAWVDGWEGSYTASPGAEIAPGDKIIVGNGTYSVTGQVGDLSVKLDAAADTLTGVSGGGRATVYAWDLDAAKGEWSGACHYAELPYGAYGLQIGGIDVDAQDLAWVWLRNPDGHYTYRTAHVFGVNILVYGATVWGYTPTPGTDVEAELWIEGGLAATRQATSSGSGQYWMALANGSPQEIRPGHTVRIRTSDGDGLEVTLPELSLEPDLTENTFTGSFPECDWVNVELRHTDESYSFASISKTAQTEPSGGFEVSFEGCAWYDCTPVLLDHECVSVAMDAYLAGEHRLQIESPFPDPALADGYEADDSHASASTYAGRQRHSMHHAADEDWVALTVSADDVARGTGYVISTLDLGVGMDTELSLYGPDGSSLIDANDDYGDGLGSLIWWTPSAPGSYYVQVTPYSRGDAGYCDAVYTLAIETVGLYLPLTMK